MRFAALLLVTCLWVAHAQDARLDAIRTTLVPMRAILTGNLKARGATPALTEVKHQLRDWIESRLSVLQWNGTHWNPNPIVLQEQLNDELNRAGLICDAQSPCRDGSELGSLGPIVLEMKRGSVLVVRTNVGVQECGYDESAYAYRPAEDSWHPFGRASRTTMRTASTFLRA